MRVSEEKPVGSSRIDLDTGRHTGQEHAERSPRPCAPRRRRVRRRSRTWLSSSPLRSRPHPPQPQLLLWRSGDKPSRGSDRDQSGDGSGCGTEGRRLARDVPFGEYPGQGCGRRAKMGCNEGRDRKTTCSERAASVEPEPPHPQQPGSSYRKRKIVRRHGSRRYPCRFPSDRAPASAAAPDEMCTTVPPAKSSAPRT